MKTFSRVLILSLTRPAYYKDVLQAHLKFSVKYYFGLSALLIVISIVAGVVNYSSSLKNDLTSSAKEAVQNFPSDLALTISPNGVTANKDFPLIAQMPSVLTRHNEQPQNLMVLDPKGEISALEKYNALILINNSYVVVDNGGSIQTSPLKDFPEIRIDYTAMQHFSRTLLFIARYAPIFTAAFFLLTGLFTFFVWRLIYLIIFALGIRLVYKGLTGSYSKAFQLSLHSATLPILLGTLLEVTTLVVPFSAWFILVHAFFTYYMLSRLEKNPQN